MDLHELIDKLNEINVVKVKEPRATFYKDGEAVGGIISQNPKVTKEKMTDRAKRWYGKEFEKKEGPAVFEKELNEAHKQILAKFQGIENGFYVFVDRKGNWYHLTGPRVGDFRKHLRKGVNVKLSYRQFSPNYADYAIDSVVYEHEEKSMNESWGDGQYFDNLKKHANIIKAKKIPWDQLGAYAHNLYNRGWDMATNLEPEEIERDLKNMVDPKRAKEEGKLHEGFNDDELQNILDRHEGAWLEFRKWHDWTPSGMGHLSPQMEAFYSDLFEYFLNSGEMPYGTAKARTGDPYNWVADKLDNMIDNEEAPMEDKQIDEGFLLTFAGMFLGIFVGLIINDFLGFYDITGPTWKDRRFAALRDLVIPAIKNLFSDMRYARIIRKLNKDPRFQEAMKGSLKAFGVFKRGKRPAVVQAMKEILSPEEYQYIDEALSRIKDKIRLEVTDKIMSKKLGKGKFGEDANDQPDPETEKKQEVYAQNLERVMGKKISQANPAEIKMAREKVKAMSGESIMSKDKKLTEDMNVTITANGEQDALCLLRKLAGIDMPAANAAQTAMAPVPATMVGLGAAESVEEAEEDRHFDNSPHEEEFGLGPQIVQGADLNRAKTSYKKEYPGDNPMAVKEDEQIDEKWGVKTTPPAGERGKHSHKTVAELRSQLSKAKARGDTDLVRELNFAIRAKTGWGKVKKEGLEEEVVDEKWNVKNAVNPEKAGMFAGKSKAELTKEYDKLKKSGPHHHGSPAFTKMRELAFAIRAKGGWGKVHGESIEESAVNEKWAHKAHINPKEKGKHSDKSVSELRSELAKAKKSGNTGLMKELNFAIRAKTGWGKVNKEDVNESKYKGFEITKRDDGKYNVCDSKGMTKHSAKSLDEAKKWVDNRKSTNEEQAVTEKLSKSDPSSKWIHDFVHSDNPKFKGKSKEERRKMALGAYYGAQKEDEESASVKAKIDEIEKANLKKTSELKETLWRKYVHTLLENMTLPEDGQIDPKEKAIHCQELAKLKMDRVSMSDASVRRAVMQKWHELEC